MNKPTEGRWDAAIASLAREIDRSYDLESESVEDVAVRELRERLVPLLTAADAFVEADSLDERLAKLKKLRKELKPWLTK